MVAIEGTVRFAVAGILASAAYALVLPTADGGRVDPFANARAKAVVLLFTRSDCPISNRYAPDVQELQRKYAPSGIDFWLVYVDPRESAEQVRQHVREYGYRLGALLDRKHELVSLAGAKVTPEAAVYANGKLVYRGRIDDRFVAFGKARRQATTRDLEEVLSAIVNGRPVAPKTTHAVGCFIEDLE